MWVREKINKTLLVSGMLLLTLYSCKKNDSGSAAYDRLGRSSAPAAVRVHLTDGPGDFDALNIDIKSIMVSINDTTWVTLPLFRPGIYNILSYRDGMDTLIGTLGITAGNITGMRLILGTDNSVVVKGVSYPLTLPLADTSVRVHLRFGRADRWEDEDDDAARKLTIVPGGVYDIYLDFDAGMSVHGRDGDDMDRDHDKYADRFVFIPMIKAYVKTNLGRLVGDVLPASAAATVYVDNGIDTISAIPKSGGYFTFNMLPEGTYQVIIVPSVTGYANDTLDNVIITSGRTTSLGTITLH